jgi:putative membrane protein
MSRTNSDRHLVTITLVVLALLVVVPVFFMGFGMTGGPMMGGGWGHDMWDGGGSAPGWALVIGIVFQLVLLLVVVATGYLIYRTLTRKEETKDPAIEELRVAYARGDLTEEEFESRRERLQAEDSP